MGSPSRTSSGLSSMSPTTTSSTRRPSAAACGAARPSLLNDKATSAKLRKFALRRNTPGDSRTPKRWRVFRHVASSARFWSAAVPCRFHIVYQCRQSLTSFRRRQRLAFDNRLTPGAHAIHHWFLGVVLPLVIAQREDDVFARPLRLVYRREDSGGRAGLVDHADTHQQRTFDVRRKIHAVEIARTSRTRFCSSPFNHMASAGQPHALPTSMPD